MVEDSIDVFDEPNQISHETMQIQIVEDCRMPVKMRYTDDWRKFLRYGLFFTCFTFEIVYSAGRDTKCKASANWRVYILHPLHRLQQAPRRMGFAGQIGPQGDAVTSKRSQNAY